MGVVRVCETCAALFDEPLEVCPADGTPLLDGSGERIGTTIGRYKLMEQIGEGGMGVVYLARDSRLGRRVAIKVLREDLPLEANTWTSGMSATYWLGPDEWLIVSPDGERPNLPMLLDDAIDGMHATMNDVGAGYVCLQISGASAATCSAVSARDWPASRFSRRRINT